MYIAPNTDIYLLKGVPLDSKYENTIYFPDVNTQTTYFQTSFTRKIFSNQSYQRVQRGYIRLRVNADDIYDYNYLMFKNTSYGSKWFYAFILNTEWINNEVAEIRFEIDVLQTWLFEAELEACLVERHHTATDAVGGNLQPENLDTGEYVQSTQQALNATDGLVIVAAASFDKNGQESTGENRGGVYSGLTLNTFEANSTGYAELNTWLSTYAAKKDEIVAIFYAPARYKNVTSGRAIPAALTPISKPTTIGAYTPRNKKLLTYPYTFAYVSNLQGTTAEYRYEFFKSANVQFYAYGDFTPNASILIAPAAYKAEAGSSAINWDEALQLTGFPQVAYNVDTFKAWLAQAASSVIAKVATGAGYGFMAGGIPGAAVGAVVGGATGGVQQVAQIPQHLIAPRQSHSTSSPTTFVAIQMFDFMYYNKHITEEFAAVIDQYFDWYGYAINRIYVPGKNNRAHWTYIKTRGCDIRGSVPTDDKVKICSIYDKGIRWFTHTSRVGQYSVALAEENMA